MALNLVESEELFDVFSTSEYARSKRQQIYQKSEISSFTQGQRISFNMPPISTDLRDAYFECDMELLNIVDEVCPQWEIRSYDSLLLTFAAVAPTSGSFNIKIKDESINILFNDSKDDIVTKLNSLEAIRFSPLEQLTYQLAVGQVGTDLFSASGSIIVELCNFASLNVNTEYFPELQNVNLVAAVPLGLTAIQNVQGEEQFPKVEYDTHSIIRRVDIEFNAQTFSECDEWNVLACLMNKKQSADYYDTFGRITAGTGLKRSWTGARRFSLRLGSTMGLLEHYFPLHLIPGVQFRINLYLEDSRRCLVWKDLAQNAGYGISNPELHYHALSISQDLTERFRQDINGQGLVMGFTSYQNLTDTLNNSQKDIITNFNFSRFLGITAVMREENFINDPTKDYKNTSYCRNSIQSYRLKIGQQYYPRDAVNLLQNPDTRDVIESVEEYVRFFNVVNDHCSVKDPYALLNFAGNYHNDEIVRFNKIVPPSFIMAISTDPHQNEGPSERHRHSSGVDVSGQTNCSLEIRNVTLQQIELIQQNNIVNLYARFNAFAVFQRNQAIFIR
jgi:hypothetical protein